MKSALQIKYIIIIINWDRHVVHQKSTIKVVRSCTIALCDEQTDSLKISPPPQLL